MPDQDKFHWAGKVSRRDIQRLYEFEAQELLDQDLLDKVIYTIHARVCDMFEVREAQQFGRVKCRSCGAPVPQPYWMGGQNKGVVLVCEQCGWQTTCGEFFESYTGKDLLPGVRNELFQDFLERFPAARTPQEKMLLLDWLIHEFHVHAGVAKRLVAQNLIQGSRDQLIELLSTLASSDGRQAAKEAWLAEKDNPIRRFRRKYSSHVKVLEVAAQLGIQGRNKMPEKELISEILYLAPELAVTPQEEKGR
jgi:RNase P subunit RPR2